MNNGSAPKFLGILALLRGFFPSWRFFEEIGHVPRLSFRTATGESDFGPWLPYAPIYKRSWHSLFLNPMGNFALAYSSLLEKLLDDINNLADPNATPSITSEPGTNHFVESVSYRLVEQIVRTQTQTGRFQFKVTVLHQGISEPVEEDVLVSIEHEA